MISSGVSNTLSFNHWKCLMIYKYHFAGYGGDFCRSKYASENATGAIAIE
jgi:hypothetical protein